MYRLGILAVLLALISHHAQARQERHTNATSLISVGSNAAFVSGFNVGWGINGEVSTNFSEGQPLYLGIGIGQTRWSISDQVRLSATQILPTLIYRFQSNRRTTMFHPYFGVASGFAFTEANLDSPEIKTQGTQANFAFLLRPGVEMGTFDGVLFGIDSRVGVLASRFTFMPQVSLSVPF